MSVDDPDFVPEALARRVIAVVPTLNEAAGIEPCLRSLLTGSPALQHVDIVVMDGGSHDGTQDIVRRLAKRHPNLRLEENPRVKQAAAMNIAAAASNRDILVRCDAHALYPKDYLLNAAQRLIETGADSLVVPMDAVPAPNAGLIGQAIAMLADTRLGAGGSAHRGGKKSGYVDHGHHAAIWLEQFQELGGYDETLPANEDAELDTRLRASGGQIYLDANLRIKYHPRTSLTALLQQYYAYGRGRAAHIVKHGAAPRTRQIIPVVHAILVALSLLALPFFAIGWAYPITYVLLMAIYGAYVSLKKGSVCPLMAPLVFATQHTVWGLGFVTEWIRQKGRL